MDYTRSMPELLTFTSADFPENLKWQAVSFLRVQWLGGFTGENRLRDWVTREDDHPIHIVLAEKDILISHANVVWRYLEHDREKSKAYAREFPCSKLLPYGQTV